MNREQSYTYGKRTPQTYFTNVWENQSDRGGCRSPYGGLEGAPPSFEKAKNLKPNTDKESKLMITHGKPKPVSPPCAPQSST